MKKIDIKSVIIGVLGTALIFVTMGATKQYEEFGDIVVNSISVKDENGKILVFLGSGTNGGLIGLYNSDGKIAGSFFSDPEGAGYLGVSNGDSKLQAVMRSNEYGGEIGVYNKYEEWVATFQTNTKHDGAIGLYDRYGDPGWVKTGKK